MKINKKILAGVLALSVAAFGFADDFDDWDDFGSDTGSDFGGFSSEPAVTIGGVVELNGRGYVEVSDSFYNGASGEIEFADRPSFGELKVDAIPSAKLDVKYEGANSDFNMKLKFDKTSLGGKYSWDILDEFTARVYMGNAQFEAGKMRVVWGKGDKIHVLDNFNANDYLDYIIPDYIDRRIAEPMFRGVYSTNSNIKFEAIYTPMMTADRLADSGVWQPKATKKLTSAVEGIVIAPLLGAIANPSATPAQFIGALMNASSFDADSLYPDTNQLKYGQYGGRMTFTVGSVDLGFSYYYGHNKQPSANLEAVVNGEVAKGMINIVAQLKKIDNPLIQSNLGLYGDAINTILGKYNTGLPELDYDMVQVFGFEAAGILFGRLNSRMEFAYNLTKDIAGDDPWVHNNSLAWVAGFDIDLPIHNVNFNIQNQGKYILNNHKIGKEEFTPFATTKFAYTLIDSLFRYSYGDYDVDADGSGCYTNNKIIVDITDSWNHEKIKLDVKGIWGIERGDVIVIPTLTFNFKDDWNLNLSGMYIWCNNENSEFDGWQRNSFVQVGVKYQF